jgi:hypothetical protein
LNDWLRLRPTPEQYREFGDYLCEAHSWYKHLDLMEGQRFVVFVAADAGFGQLVAVDDRDNPGTVSLVTPPEGPEFTDEHPRLHYGWTTTTEYRRRFGHLDYSCWREEDGAYARDAGPPVTLPDELVERCGFVLYPYVSGEFAEAVTWSVHADAIEQLRAGAPHPARAEVLELARLAEASSTAWNALSDGESDWVVGHGTEREKPLPGDASDDLRRYLALRDRVGTIARSLGAQEAEKIRRALTALDDWLLHRG